MKRSSYPSLPTVNSLSSRDSQSQNSNIGPNDMDMTNNTPSQSRMKRSPYLSAMTTDREHEGEDLVALLSRPSGGGGSAGGGGGMTRSDNGSGGGAGGMQFFNLKRPSSSMQMDDSDEGGQQQGQDQSQQDIMGGMTTGGASSGGATTSSTAAGARISSLRSALRVNSTTRMQQQSHTSFSTDNSTNNNMGGASGIKKNTSVTFSTNTKNPSRLGLQSATADRQQQVGDAAGATVGNTISTTTGVMGNNDAFPLFSTSAGGGGGGGGILKKKDYSAGGMMRKSQSICAPEYLLAHSGSSTVSGSSGGARSGGAESAAAAGGGGGSSGGGEGNASFPIYFAKLGTAQSSQHQPQPQEVTPQHPQGGLYTQPTPPPPQSSSPTNNHVRRKSKSMNTLQYSYQNDELFLQSPASNNPHSTNNNQHDTTNKLFSALGINPSSRVNLKFRDMLDEGDGHEGDLNLRLRNQQWKDFRLFSEEFESENPMLVSIEEGSGGGGGGGGSASSSPVSRKSSTSSLSGSKRAISPSSSSNQSSFSSVASSSNNKNAAAAFMNSFGSHRQLNADRASVSVNDLAMLRRSAARMRVAPTTTTGGTAVNSSSSSSRNSFTTRTAPGATLGGEMLSRISSKNSLLSSNSSMGSGAGGAGGLTRTPTTEKLSPLAQMMAKSANLSSKQQQDLFLSKAIHERGLQHQSSQMGRRVHTVGAGLAYGGPNLSRFDLGSLRKDLSIMSGGSGSSGGKNEEWDL